LGDKEKQEVAALKETARLAKDKAKQEETEWKEAERLSRERAKQEQKEAEAARKEAEKLAKEKAKQEEAARKEAERQPKDKAKDKAEKEQGEAEATSQVKEKPKQEEAPRRLAEDKNKRKKEPAAPALYQGRVKLVVESPVDLGKLAQMQASLNNVDGLQLVMVGGSAGAAQIIVSVERPLPLLDVLEAIPVTDGVVKKGKEIKVVLKAE
jgi:hypothetical protein